MADLFHDALQKYQAAPQDNPLSLVIMTAALDGVVVLEADEHTIAAHEAKNGRYDVADLLLPVDLDTWKSSARFESDLFPTWIEWNPKNDGFLDFRARDLCAAFISAYKLTKHGGEFFADGKSISIDDVKERLSRSLAIVRKNPDKYIYDVFSALKVLCRDDAPPGRKERLSLFALDDAMRARGFEIRFNEITCACEIKGYTASGRPLSKADLETLLHDELADTYRGVTFEVISQYTTFLARENSFNPVLDELAKVEWDHRDRLPEVYRLLGIEDDDLSKTLVRKWLYQTVALLFNSIDDPFGADGCLVLNGGQGIGKTSFFRHLALRNVWFGEGCMISDYDKDTKRRVVTKWISELGEIETTLKSDIEALKNFISDPFDAYRLPFGRIDTESPRHVSLCGTCNTGHFLIDQTGNRRFWTVPLTRVMPYAEIQALDALQLWGQIYSDVAPLSYADTAACFRLTAGEQQALAVRNGAFEKPVKAQMEVQDILDQVEEKNLQQREMSVTEFKRLWSDELRNYPANQLSAALRACGVEIRHTRYGSKALLPTPYIHG